MKALSVKQPYATLLVDGAKTIEVRTWQTPHRGPLLISASAAPKNCFWKDTDAGVHRLMHSGCIIGIVNLIDVRPMVKADEDAAGCDLMPNAWSWVTEPISYCEPKPIKGALHLYDVADSDIVRFEQTDELWIYDYPCPQGEVRYTKACPLLI
jgi:hypothetical protein